MKVIKKFLYLVCVMMLFLSAVLIATLILQAGGFFLKEHFSIAVSDDRIIALSGNGGTAAAALLGALYVRRVIFQKEKTVLCLKGKRAFFCMLFSVSFCKVLVEGIIGSIGSRFLPVEPFHAGDAVWLDYLASVILAPIFEELLFRYGLYNIIRQKFSDNITMIITTVIFTAMHGYGLQGSVSCFAAAVLFTLIYRKTNDIRYCIFAHMSCNAFSAIMNAVNHAGVELWGIPLNYDKNGYNMSHPVLMASAAVVCGIIFLYVTALRRFAAGAKKS